MNSIPMTKKQAEQFNQMLSTLKRISKHYESSSKIRRTSQKDYALEYEEALEYAYDNIQADAKDACKGIKPIEI